MKHRDKQILLKILKEIDIAIKMIDGVTLKEFMGNEVLKRAICMTIINIGELVKNIKEETRKENKQIPWKEIAGFRDITAHKYQTLKMEDVYCTVKDDIPKLSNEINKII